MYEEATCQRKILEKDIILTVDTLIQPQKNPKQKITINPKIDDPLLYPYPATTIEAAYYNDFSQPIKNWCTDREIDSLVKIAAVISERNNLQLNTADSSLSVHTNSDFDFSRNFEYEILFNLKNGAKEKVKLSLCLGMDTASHDHGLSVYVDENGNFNFATPAPHSRSKKWRGTWFQVPKKYRQNEMKLTIRHLNNRYDIFINDRFLGKLKDAPIFKNSMIHFGNYQLHSSVTFQSASIVYL